MPRVPLFDSHGKSIDIFIEEFKQTNGLNDGFILSVDIEGNLVSGEGMSKTQSGLFKFDVFELFVFQEVKEMLSESSNDFIDHS